MTAVAALPVTVRSFSRFVEICPDLTPYGKKGGRSTIQTIVVNFAVQHDADRIMPRVLLRPQRSNLVGFRIDFISGRVQTIMYSFGEMVMLGPFIVGLRNAVILKTVQNHSQAVVTGWVLAHFWPERMALGAVLKDELKDQEDMDQIYRHGHGAPQ